MLKKKLFIVCLLVIFLLFLFVFLYQKISNQKERKNTYQLNSYELSLLKEGDLIFRQGFGLISDIIAGRTKETYTISHCGILCKDSNNEWIVIHTVSNTLAEIDGIQSDNLSRFVKNSKENSILILRYKNACDSTNTLIKQKSFYYLNKQIAFDDSFDMQDTSEFYCTELIRHIFLDVYHVDIYNLHTETSYDVLGFSPFWDKKTFEPILSHQGKKTD
ncbi:MAG: YiiX/YebB-like N1pC/P60 family cysteine hydrolase [Bacteroidales bacterium]|nr:YiiX/YebB-like N1pC/P60 family cysteine hydrolase [Bacteroidales bacterium]